jgi:hypothetical protein
MTYRTPRELIELYWEEVWNKGNVELIREICGNPMIRHNPGWITQLDHEQQIGRVRGRVESMKPRFTHEVLIADERHVSSVWNMFSTSEKYPRMCGIETFRAENGRLTECWNPGYGFHLWDEGAEDLPHRED